MRTRMIDDYIHRLKASLGEIRPPFDDTELLNLFNARDIPGMVRHVRKSMNITHPIRVGLVNAGGPPEAPAWLDTAYSIEEKNIFFGVIKTKKIVGQEISLFIRKSFVDEGFFEPVVAALSHEMAHVLLNLTNHSLRKEEAAVDLTAMLMGYRDFFLTGCRYFKDLGSDTDSRYRRFAKYNLGYLRQEEIKYAAYVMTYGKPPNI